MIDRELLYEKITNLIEIKDKILQENENLKIQLKEASNKILAFEAKEKESGEKEKEERNKKMIEEIVQFCVTSIIDKAKASDLDPKVIAQEILARIK